MSQPWIPARALAALLATHAVALCAITGLFAMVIAGGQSRIAVVVPIAFCAALVMGAIAVYFAAGRLQRRGRHNPAVALVGAYVVAPPLALAGFLY